MGGFERRGGTINAPARRRSAGGRLADLGDKLARSVSPVDRARSVPEDQDDTEYLIEDERDLQWDNVLPRFPITKQGYDCAAVDEQVAELERELTELDQELADLRAQMPSRSETAAEIEKIGEQTSAILLAAHESAQQTAREAEAQADRCVADAAANAIEITTQANRKLSDLQSETGMLYRERERLLEDVRGVADALGSLADRPPMTVLAEPQSREPVSAAGATAPERVTSSDTPVPEMETDTSETSETGVPAPQAETPADD
jgi:hypothetical protein